MQRYKLTIEYNGTDYAGWQSQDGLPTIQDSIEEAIYKFSSQKVRLQAAGRTDSGVHAYAQVAHVDLAPFNKAMTPFEVSKAINAHLRPRPITIINAEEVSSDFHARYGSKQKIYRYRIINRRALLALDIGRAWHFKRPLDVEAMHEAAQVLIGHHDFSSFRDSDCQAKSPMRTIDRIDVTQKAYDPYDGKEITIEVQGQSFLHHQVRNIAGSLSLVGEGKWSAHDLKDALEARDRARGGPTAPADGLYLVEVQYGDDVPLSK